MKLQGCKAFVTGAAQGIGRASVEALLAEGAEVALADIQSDKAQALATALGGQGRRAVAVTCDVSDSASTRAAIDRAADALGGLNVLFANAATKTPTRPIAEITEEEWQRALAVNLTGCFHVVKHGVRHLRASGGGSIILTASQMGRVAWAGSTAYCTTKGALLNFAKGVALDYAGDRIRCNTLSPGGIATERMQWRFGDLDTAEREWGPTHPMGRLGRPEEMARGVVFLASRDSSFMTGADLLMDGGYTAW